MKRPGEPHGESIDAAFNRILAAEREAREAVERCRREAQARIARAEQEVESIADRAGHRIQSAHAIADRGIGRALAALRSPADDAGDELPAPASAEVEAIVSELARELTEAPR